MMKSSVRVSIYDPYNLKESQETPFDAEKLDTDIKTTAALVEKAERKISSR